MEHLIDLGAYPVRDVLHILLQDRTTKQNIIWAADTYEAYGEEYEASRCIRAELLLNGPTIQPRIAKNVDAQLSRIKKFAEVFTPAWLCNQMNNYCDEVWFGRKDVFNHAEGSSWTPTEGAVIFPKRKRWQRYVDSRRLEITCGEAPYLTSRYDTVTGELIPFDRRIGVLDRKLRIVNENAADQEEWLKFAFRALESVYGFEYQGDNLLIARVNVLMTFMDAVQERWQREATALELKRAAEIISWNIWQMDGLKGAVPFGSLQKAHTQLSIWNLLGEMIHETENKRPECQIYDWRGQGKLKYNDRKTRKGKEMKFDFVIGNPPYQEQTDSDSSRMPPVYDKFMDASYKVGEKVELITPARFLFNAGYTPKAWNEKMLADPHFKVLFYEPNSSSIFPNTDIKGGIAISYRDDKQDFGAIGTFTKYPELNYILRKVKSISTSWMDSIAYPPLSYGLTAKMLSDYPNSIGRLRTSAFTKLSEIFFNEKPNDGNDYISLLGLEASKRVLRFVRLEYIEDKHGILHKWNLLLPEAIGTGNFGETLPSAFVAAPKVGYLQTFVGLGCFDSEEQALNLNKYIKTKFVRSMLGIIKITQHCSPNVWKMVPLQDFTPFSDIDWSASVAEIDRQLYRKYNLSEEEIAFIETKVKEMA